MRRKVFVSFFLILSLFMYPIIIFAPITNGLFQIDNYYQAALPGESVHFDMNLVNNEVNRETFLIYHVWEDSVLWLPMDLVDNQVYDYSSVRNHGTVYGASWVDGKYGKALSFYGENDYVNVPHSASLNITDAITVEAWINIKSYVKNGGILNKYVNTAVGSWFLALSDAPPYDKLYWKFYDVDDVIHTGVSTKSLSLNQWYHIVWTYDSVTPNIYVNGFAESFPAINKALRLSLNPVKIGDVANNHFNGTIDEVRIYNRALTAEEIGWLYNNSWSESLSNYNVELGPGESTQVTFSVKVPENASAGLVKFLLTAFPTSNPESIDTQTVTVEVLPKYSVEVSLDENEKKGKPGEILNFQAAIRNLGNIEDIYDIRAEGGEGWNLSLPAESLTVPAEEVGSFNISVTVPFDALPGDYTSFRIQAASRGNQNLTKNVNGTAIATAIYRFNITTDPELRQTSPGSEAIFSLELKNLGTAPDTIGLEVENLIGWDIKVDPSSISLEIGETGKATVRVRVPEDALIGQTNTITIHAVSSGDPTVSANSSISIEIVTPFWDIPDVRFIVGLSIGVLVGATLISTIILRRAQINRKENRRS